VTLHGLGELIVSCSGREPDFRVQRKEPDVVAMPSRRRTRPHIANFTTVISALDTRSGDMLLLGNVRINVALLSRNVIENPVCETAGLGRIRIVKNQNKGELTTDRSGFHDEIFAITIWAINECQISSAITVRATCFAHSGRNRQVGTLRIIGVLTG